MRHLSRKVVLVVAGFATVVVLAAAQAPAQKPSFEVASLSAKAVDLSELAQFLSAIADRPVLNRTGIIGLFDITTTPFKPAPGSSVEGNADPETVPTIFTMLPEQLGLRLVPSKALIEVLVIDSVQKPSEN